MTNSIIRSTIARSVAESISTDVSTDTRDPIAGGSLRDSSRILATISSRDLAASKCPACRLRSIKRAAATSAGHSQCRWTIRLDKLPSQSVGVPELVGIPGKCQCETRIAPFEASASCRKIKSLSRLKLLRQPESPTPFDSNSRSKMSSLSITTSPRKGASSRANRDLPLPGIPETTTNALKPTPSNPLNPFQITRSRLRF